MPRKGVSQVKKGFTLIELLIVIAILGILAIGLMAALDPLEQLKRARDTATRSTVEEFYNAALRYYSTKEKFPWTTDRVEAQTLVGITDSYIQSLINAGELKERFQDDTSQLKKIVVTSTHADFLGGMDDLAVCFHPESKSIQDDENSKYDVSGITDSDCPSIGGTCYWCIK